MLLASEPVHCADTRPQQSELWSRKVQQHTTSHTPVRQPFDTLPVSPPLPIVDISRTFIQQQAHVPVISYLNQSIGYSKGGKDFWSGDKDRSNRLLKRQNSGQCGPGTPCPDGSCCNKKGGCGFGPENCGSGNCTGNCKWSTLLAYGCLTGILLDIVLTNAQAAQPRSAEKTALAVVSSVLSTCAAHTMATVV